MKTFLFSILSVITLLGSHPALAQTKIEEIEQYEIRAYDPQKRGLTDLVFEARIDKLAEALNKTQNFGRVTDVVFKIYWLSPSQYKIEVGGLQKGFQELRDELSNMIKAKLEFVIPENFSDKFKGYTLKVEPLADGKLIKAIDDTYTMAVPEMDLNFDKNGRLRAVESRAPFTAIKSEFTQSPKAWSNNKLVLDKIVTVTKQGAATSTSTNTVEYVTVAGMGFPAKITVKNVMETIVPARGKEKEKKVKAESGTVVRFSNYEVNTGKAQRFMTEGLRR